MINNAFYWLKETARTYPNKIAICDENGFITYKDYYNKSIAIAAEILKIKTMLDSTIPMPVVVFMNKSYKEIVSFGGVALSGNYYSPIDVDMPIERINTILSILDAPLMITSVDLSDKVDALDYRGKIIYYEEVFEFENQEIDVLEVTKKTIDTDLLYVLFTSGSTGVPKGVCISHRSVIDYIDWVIDTFLIEVTDTFGNQAPLYFDNSVLDIYSCMRTGATLFIVPSDLFHQPVLLLEYIKNKEINTIFWVPSALMVVSHVQAFKNVDLGYCLKRVLFCGEVMPTKQLNIWRRYLPNVLYANLYGPTEITDVCSYYIVDRELSDDESLPIGGPCSNTGIIVLDENDKLVKNGQPGELCVRGTSLALGYYGDFDKTKEVFVQNPLNKRFEEKIYRTGDIVKYNEYDELVFLCRKDYQIKLMGHRIELGEIETAVSSFEEITRCCCIYDEEKKKIILFLDADLDKQEVKRRLKEKLPSYMIPGRIVYIDSFPLNINGKIDRLRIRELL